jgi:signal transduction histidine kinase
MTHSYNAPSDSLPEQKDVGPIFLANFVHQVVNPINGVIGTLDNINDGTYKGPVIDKKINACRAQLEQCVSLIRNLAYLSDYFFESSSKEALKPVREGGVSVLPQVIIEAIQFFQIAADRKGMRIELTDSRTQYVVSVRPELLRQVFMNLFDNWLKYGLNDQVVNVAPSVNKKGDLVVNISGASVSFLNNEAERLFELGFRSTSATAKVAQGSGIGLYVCRQIMEKSIGGSITAAHQKAGSISTFRMSIPKQKWLLAT